VTCFSERQKSFLMWSHYANGHRGMCIGLNTEKIPVPPEKGYCSKITYRRERVPIGPRNAAKIALSKSVEWRYEKEWRILMAKCDLTSGSKPISPGKDGKRTEPGHFLKLPCNALESIWFGAKVNSDHRARILRLLGCAGRAHVRAIQLHLSYSAFELEEEVLKIS